MTCTDEVVDCICIYNQLFIHSIYGETNTESLCCLYAYRTISQYINLRIFSALEVFACNSRMYVVFDSRFHAAGGDGVVAAGGRCGIES